MVTLLPLGDPIARKLKHPVVLFRNEALLSHQSSGDSVFPIHLWQLEHEDELIKGNDHQVLKENFKH
ncbi:hypothetical protein AYJ22_16185 [Ferroacidibacillus organovorans]|nr:hypothetical protein AYJ22_16185 [Ferroacidibacillus organovorans]